MGKTPKFKATLQQPSFHEETGSGGLASGLANTSQQIGGALGTAVLAAVAAAVTAGATDPTPAQVLGAGYRAAFLVAAASVAAALVVGQLPAFTDAVATMGAVTQPLAYGPTVLLQLAQKFTGLVVPSTVGITAMNARFLNLQGVPVATAVTSGVLVSFGGLIVQLILFLISFLHERYRRPTACAVMRVTRSR